MGYAVASSFAAHLDFVHVEGEIADAVEFTRDIDFARGMGLQLSLRKLKCDCEIDGQAARLHVEDFCDRNEISGGLTAPYPCDKVTGKWQSIDHDGPRRLISLARQHDLVIMGRSSRRRFVFTPPNGESIARMRPSYFAGAFRMECIINSDSCGVVEGSRGCSAGSDCGHAAVG